MKNNAPKSTLSQNEWMREKTMRDLGYRPYVKMRNTTRFVDMTGKRCGTIFIVEPTAERDGNQVKWACICMNCGRALLVAGSSLRGKNAQKSCGCLTREILSSANTRHGMTDTPTWKSWKSMIDRCFLKKHKSYADYGGRGIFPCDEWLVFEKFLIDMGERPKNMTLGRINNSLGYFAANCRWETASQQARNRRSSRFIDAFGENMTIAEWGDRFGIERGTIGRRLRQGWAPEAAIATPKRKLKYKDSLRDAGHNIKTDLVMVQGAKGPVRVGVYWMEGPAR